MIPFEFTYCRPDTLQEAAQAYEQLQREGKSTLYYGGGSEIITMCRGGSLQPGAVIDLKAIPECTQFHLDEGHLHIGAACTLNQIKELKVFPLLGLACGRIADHTNQCRITLGGNLCGTILYRETSLPLLLSDAMVTLMGPKGERRLSFKRVFPGSMQLNDGEWIVAVHIPRWALSAKHAHIKHTTNEKIDYPLVSVAALWKGDHLRAAFSGVVSYPLHSEAIDAVLNDHAIPCQTRAEQVIRLLPEAPQQDVEGSRAYRSFLLTNTLTTLLEEWEHGSI